MKSEWTFHSGNTLSTRKSQTSSGSICGRLTNDDNLAHLAKERGQTKRQSSVKIQHTRVAKPMAAAV